MVQKDSVNNVIIVCGPTASGKTSLAVNLAKILDSEVISADSMLVYKGFDVGAAKPTKEEMQGVKHHLIDVVDGASTFSVADYREAALPIVHDLLSRGKTPIICGGTGFYINSLLFNFSYGNASANTEIREKYNKLLIENGVDFLYNELKKCDPLTAKKLHPNDTKRVIRALEIFETAGIPKSSYVDDVKSQFNYVAVSCDFDREVLYSRIDKRVDVMLQNGLVFEVQKLLLNGILPESQAMQGIGYKEVVRFLKGECSYENAVEEIKRNSRRYAKRQITFFKRLNGLKYVNPDTCVEDTLKIIKENFGE